MKHHPHLGYDKSQSQMYLIPDIFLSNEYIGPTKPWKAIGSVEGDLKSTRTVKIRGGEVWIMQGDYLNGAEYSNIERYRHA